MENIYMLIAIVFAIGMSIIIFLTLDKISEGKRNLKLALVIMMGLGLFSGVGLFAGLLFHQNQSLAIAVTIILVIVSIKWRKTVY